MMISSLYVVRSGCAIQVSLAFMPLAAYAMVLMESFSDSRLYGEALGFSWTNQSDCFEIDISDVPRLE